MKIQLLKKKQKKKNMAADMKKEDLRFILEVLFKFGKIADKT